MFSLLLLYLAYIQKKRTKNNQAHDIGHTLIFDAFVMHYYILVRTGIASVFLENTIFSSPSTAFLILFAAAARTGSIWIYFFLSQPEPAWAV